MTEDQAKFYVASQCRRWKEAPAGRTLPPGIRYDWPFGKPNSQAYYLATFQTSRCLKQRMSVATQAGAWISELRVRRNTFGLALDLAGLMIPVERLSPAECAAIIQTLLIESGIEYPSSDATTRGVKRKVPSTSSVRSSSAFSSGIFRATGGSDESLPSATSGSRVSRDSTSGSSGWSFGIGVGTHMPLAGVIPQVMTAQETGGAVPIEGYVQTYISPEDRRRVPLEFDQHDVEMSDPEPQRKSSRPPKVGRRRSHSRRSDYPEDDSEDERHRRRRRSRSRHGDVRPRRERTPSVSSKYSERTARSGRSSRSSTSGMTQVALTAIHEVKDSMAQMQKTQETLMVSALALREAGNMGVKEEQKPLLDDVRQQVVGSQYPEISQVEVGHSAQDILESRFADYQRRPETHMETQRRQHLDEMAAFEKEFLTLRLERDQEREANKNLQSFLVGRLKKQAERQGVYDNGLKPAP
ncbi:hypothetical protein PHMEG_00032434 [Phytophthora megakarya]|uniref:Uncharacterized protein n=1 Tax=Phytophthora megakarya TaxID=4795 RepID=A0A225UWE7_9STRA|nr:hypothetical protein PHMEG_00032434 [Phytophthora megakarya]